MVEIEVRGTGGVSVPVSEPGEVCVRGEAVMKGYWNDLQASAAALTKNHYGKVLKTERRKRA